MRPFSSFAFQRSVSIFFIILLVLIVVPSHRGFVTADEEIQESHPPAEQEEGDHTKDDPSPPQPKSIPHENGIYTPFTIKDVTNLISNLQQEHLLEQTAEASSSSSQATGGPAVLLLLVVYDSDCVHCPHMIQKMEEAAKMVEIQWARHQAQFDSHIIPPVLGKIPVTHLDAAALHNFGVSRVPTLVFIRGNGHENYLLEYSGKDGTAEDIFQTIWHYFYRLIVTAGAVRLEEASINVYPRLFGSVSQVQDFLQQHLAFFREVHAGTHEMGLHPTLGQPEADYIRWLLRDDRDDDDDLVVLVQCRQTAVDHPWYKTFNTMSQVLSPRRDRFFAPIEQCPENMEDGTVLAWQIPVHPRPDDDLWWSSWDLFPVAWHSPTPELENDDEKEDDSVLIEFMVKLSTPPVLWFDRESTAPIAFSHYRKVHAVLFLDLHRHHGRQATNNSNDEENNDGGHQHDAQTLASREAVRRFRQECRHQKTQSFRTDLWRDHNVVCLIVPSTETRILNTFGVDLWTPLDQAAREGRVVTEPLLPRVLITDQRPPLVGTRRYYLESKEILSFESAIHDFFREFWAGALQQNVKSDLRGPRTTSLGIRMVTSQSVQEDFLLERGSHALMLFTSPTCGHCKRFSVIWRELASLLQDVQWEGDFLQLYQMDVTTNDPMHLNLTVRWVPDLYYFSPDRTDVVRYNETDDMGDDVGKIGSPLEILAWFLTEGSFDKPSELQKVLQQLESLSEQRA